MSARRQGSNQFPRYKPVRRIHRDRSSGVKLIFTEKEIGRGAYGRVTEVDYAGTLCAAKQMHSILLLNATESELGQITKNFLKECDIWSKLRHPHIVQLLEVYPCCDDYSRLPIIIMEKMLFNLRSLVETYSHIPLHVKAFILYGVGLGLKYLHSCNPPIAHRDITPNNILLGANLEAKITDMGVAKVLQCDAKATMTKAPGTASFMPPESLDDSPHYGLSLDVFSYGAVTLYTITQLWPELRPWVVIKPNGKPVRLSEVQRRQYYIDRVIGGAEELRTLVVSCLDDNPNRRPTIAEVSETIEAYKVKTEMCMGKPIEWWASVSSSHQQQHQVEQNIPLDAQVEILKKENEDLKSELQITKQFMKAKKVMKSYEKYTKKHKPDHRPVLQQQSHLVRSSDSRSFVRHLSMNIHKYHRKCIEQIPKKLPHSSSYPYIDKLV